MNQTPSLLIVDDNRGMVKALQDISAMVNVQSVGAGSGAEALQALTQRPFDCVLSDVVMAELDGVTLHQAIRERWPDTLFILMTTYMTEDLVTEQLAAGALAVLEKPLEAHHLVAFLNYLKTKQTVAVVSDEGEIRPALQRHGYTVIPTTPSEMDGQTLITTASLILLRYVMTSLPQLPALRVTARHKKVAAAAIRKRGAYGYLSKPLIIKELLKSIADVQRAKMRRLLIPPK